MASPDKSIFSSCFICHSSASLEHFFLYLRMFVAAATSLPGGAERELVGVSQRSDEDQGDDEELAVGQNTDT